MVRTLVGVVAVAAIACSAPTGPVTVGPTVMQGLRLVNNTSEPIYYFAVECNAAALINWAACTDPAHCNSVPARQVRSIPYNEIAFYTPAAERAIVYWWHLRPTGNGAFAPDTIRALQVGLLRPGA